MVTTVAVHYIRNVNSNYLGISKFKIDYYNVLGQRVYPAGRGQNFAHTVLIAEQKNIIGVRFIPWNKVVQ